MHSLQENPCPTPLELSETLNVDLREAKKSKNEARWTVNFDTKTRNSQQEAYVIYLVGRAACAVLWVAEINRKCDSWPKPRANYRFKSGAVKDLNGPKDIQNSIDLRQTSQKPKLGRFVDHFLKKEIFHRGIYLLPERWQKVIDGDG